MPAAVAEERHEPDAAGEQIGEGDEVGLAETRRRIERRQREMQRRKDERLRIGDLRPTGEHIGSPKRRFAACQRCGEERQFRLELSLGIPRDGDGTGPPRP